MHKNDFWEFGIITSLWINGEHWHIYNSLVKWKHVHTFLVIIKFFRRGIKYLSLNLMVHWNQLILAHERWSGVFLPSSPFSESRWYIEKHHCGSIDITEIGTCYKSDFSISSAHCWGLVVKYLPASISLSFITGYIRLYHTM